MTSRAITVALLLALSAPGAPAQGIVGGTLLEARTTRPLACWDVELRTADDRVVARTVTRRDGTFEFPAPPAGPHRIRFTAFGLQPITTTIESTGPSMDHESQYWAALTLTDSLHIPRPDTVPSAPQPVRGRGTPRYPLDLRDEGIEGNVYAAFLVDSSGRVDPATTFFWGATHPGFERATRRAMPELRFILAERPGRAGCAFMGTPYLFRLERPFE